MISLHTLTEEQNAAVLMCTYYHKHITTNKKRFKLCSANSLANICIPAFLLCCVIMLVVDISGRAKVLWSMQRYHILWIFIENLAWVIQIKICPQAVKSITTKVRKSLIFLSTHSLISLVALPQSMTSHVWIHVILTIWPSMLSLTVVLIISIF